jgi:hypothetical protein
MIVQSALFGVRQSLISLRDLLKGLVPLLSNSIRVKLLGKIFVGRPDTSVAYLSVDPKHDVVVLNSHGFLTLAEDHSRFKISFEAMTP